MNFIAFDTETTGFGDDTEICQISFVKFKNGVATENFTTLIKPSPNAKWVAAASKVNGISKSTVRDAPTLREIQRTAKAFIGDLPIVAHNASFDVNKWVTEGGFPIQAICTQELHLKVCGAKKKAKLKDAAAEFALSANRLHDAEEDANLCGRLFLALLDKSGNSSIASLLAQYPSTFITATDRSIKSTKAAEVTEHSMRKSDFEELANHPKYGSIQNEKLSGKFVIFSQTKTIKASDGQLAMALFGGRSLDNVSKETDYLVVTDPEASKLKPTTKVKAALHLMSKGAKIQIISEATFLAWASTSLALEKASTLWKN